MIGFFLLNLGKMQIMDKKKTEVWRALTNKLGDDFRDSVILKKNVSFKLGKIKFQVLKVIYQSND